VGLIIDHLWYSTVAYRAVNVSVSTNRLLWNTGTISWTLYRGDWK